MSYTDPYHLTETPQTGGEPLRERAFPPRQAVAQPIVCSLHENPAEVNLERKQFAPLSTFFSDKPTDIFDYKDYYKEAIAGEGELSDRLHTLLSKYLNTTDPADRTVYRQQITASYWEFIKSAALKMTSPETSMSKHMLMRYAVVLPSLFATEQKKLFSSAFIHNTTGEPVYYLDEWFAEIASGRIGLSATDEGRQRKISDPAEELAHIQKLQSKNSGKLQNIDNMLRERENERAMIEVELRSRVDNICIHPAIPEIGGHHAAYSDSQKRMLHEINERLKLLLKADREISHLLKEYEETRETDFELARRRESVPDSIGVHTADLSTEADTVHQMAKMTVGRKGNHFPVFTREYYHCTPRATGFRENVVDILRWIEETDPQAFCRTHKSVINRIVPFIILLPTYGDMGICWEPFDRYNRITSRARLAVPMYPRDLKIAVLSAVADLRWQVAKEKASYYWMEEGLTGQYYQSILNQKLKGDVKQYFIADYILWMTKESEGVQKLSREVRGIFWRFMPFAQDIKEKLKTRSLIYQELYQRDLNRAMSDGY